jgi:CelD/BcsL family acetyltransferase involved in cellulose biosynthesis
MTTVPDNRVLSEPRLLPAVSARSGGAEIVDELAEEWRGLCDESADDQPFFRPEWIAAYLRSFAPGGKVVLITARLEGRLCLVLPLISERASFNKVPLRRLRAPVDSHCGRFDAVRRLGAQGDAAVRATWQFLQELDGWDLLQFRDVSPGSTVARIAAEARADGFHTIQLPDNSNPYVPVPATLELMDQMPPNSKLRSQLRQARRRLAELGTLRFYREETADPRALERFYRLEASGWKGRTGSCVLYDGSRRFYDEVAESAARFGYFSLYMLELNGMLLAAHFSFTHRGLCYSPKVAYNEDFKQFAPGHLIICEILRDCVTRGIYGYDITGEDHPWKLKWTSELRRVDNHFVFKGALGKLAYTIGSKLRPAVGLLLPKRRKIAQAS